MSDDERRMRELCLNHCVYYKPGKDEELACLGFLVIKEMIEEGRSLDLAERWQPAGAEVERMLAKELCPRCPFNPDDCDYILKEGDAAPCGGFVALSGLIQARCITVRDAGDVIERIC